VAPSCAVSPAQMTSRTTTTAPRTMVSVSQTLRVREPWTTLGARDASCWRLQQERRPNKTMEQSTPYAHRAADNCASALSCCWCPVLTMGLGTSLEGEGLACGSLAC